MTTKPISINDAKRRSGGCAWKAVKLTSGGLPHVPDVGTERATRLAIVWQKSAEGAVPASERKARHSSERRETACASRGRDNREGPNGPRKGLNGAASKV